MLGESIRSNFEQSSPLFPYFQRSVAFLIKPKSASQENDLLVLAISSQRIRTDASDFDDIEDYVPTGNETILTNDILN
jgi:hypothetical protein